MKIQKIRFKNLNSLAGEWEIDLTDDTYTTDGIFAITGATGSGKTTILDAICLALYGCTPRLRTISNSTNEIMHRRAADCSAEVEIATGNGVFRCTWAQKRAYGKQDGTLQQPRHEIADARTNKIFTSKKSEVPKLVEELTGMDYKRFSRSVMLAQGDFAAFLNATADERSPLLEQITGTEIYSKISVKVHERRRDEQAKLNELKAKVEGIELLPEDETAALRDEREALIQTGETLQKEISHCRKGIEWHKKGAEIARSLVETEREEADWTEERAAGEEKLSRLQKGETAAAQEGPYHRVTTLRESREKDTISLSQTEAVLLNRKDAVCQAEDAVSLQKKLLTRVQEQADQAAPVIREVRDLEHKLQSGADRLLEVTDAQKRADKDWESACADLHRGADERVSTPEETEASEWFLTNKGIAGDPAHLFAEIRNVAKELTAADPCTTRPMPAEVAKRCTMADTEIATLQQYLTKILCYNDPATLRAEINASQGQKTRLTLLRDRLSDDEEDTRKIRDITIRLSKNQEKYAGCHQELKGCIHKRERQELLTEHMEENARLAARIRDLETERSHLSVGESCPLCGSKVHPYTDGTATLPHVADKELKQEQKSLTALRKKETVLNKATTRCESEIKATREARDEIQVRRAHREETWAEGCRICGLNPDTPESEGMVQAALEQTNEAIRRYDMAETAIHTLKKELRATETLITHCRQAVLRCGDARRCAVRSAEIQAEMAEIRVKQLELLPDISPDEAEAQFTRMILAEKEKLDAVQNNYQKNVQEIAGLGGNVQTLRKSIKRQEEELERAESRFREVVCNAGFFGEEDFAAALLKPEEKSALKSEKERLDRWESGISTKREIARKEAEVHRRQAAATKDEATLAEELYTLTKTEQEANTRRGEIRQKLREEEEKKARSAEQQILIAAQQSETNRWNELHYLIGSENGKKFRNFAQGLTFAVMVASANRQLQTMNGRYLLKQNPIQPLDLEVMDNEQGGAIRSTKNLSGGESFLVSLALALGLASMASGKIQVDSLFLDEGFGTLDENALEMALSTLSSLRDQGKMIGVISHVPALKERIATVIQVTKKSGGRSTVEGPGVIQHGL